MPGFRDNECERILRLKAEGSVMKGNRQYGTVLLILLSVCIVFCGGCASADETEETRQEETEQERLQIGMSFDSFVIERWLRDRDQFVMTAQELGADVNVQVANGDLEEQISQIGYFIKKNVDVIVVIAVDGEGLTDAIREARRKGIRVVCYDRLVMDADTNLYISFDNEMVGALMAQAMTEALPDGGNIFAIYGSPADHNVSLVQEGFLKGIEGSGLNIVYSAYCDNWLAELAFDAVEEGLSTTPRNLVGVMCGNDDLASQAFRALSENRLADKVVLVGQDAELSACQRIVEGTQYMTVYKPVEKLAMRAAEFACALGYEKMLEEGRVEEEELPPSVPGFRQELKDLASVSDGTSDVPYYSIPPVPVTRENIDEEIIESGFHTEEEVYLNVTRAR